MLPRTNWRPFSEYHTPHRSAPLSPGPGHTDYSCKCRQNPGKHKGMLENTHVKSENHLRFKAIPISIKCSAPPEEPLSDQRQVSLTKDMSSYCYKPQSASAFIDGTRNSIHCLRSCHSKGGVVAQASGNTYSRQPADLSPWEAFGTAAS